MHAGKKFSLFEAIVSLARTIEIDLREMLDETDLPGPVEAVHDILV